MRIKTILAASAACFCITGTAFAQEVPVGNITWSISCSLSDGVTMAEAVAWARERPRDGTGPVATFFRQPVVGPGGFRENYDFRIVNYFPSVSAWTDNMSATRSREVQRAVQRRSDYFTCDPASIALQRVRTVEGTGGTPLEPSTLMTTRFCRLEDGFSVGDAYRAAVGIANNFRRGGDTTLMQVVSRFVGPVENRQGNAVVLTNVGSSPESMAARMDMGREGLRGLAGVDARWSCNYPALWRTHQVYSMNN